MRNRVPILLTGLVCLAAGCAGGTTGPQKGLPSTRRAKTPSIVP